MLHFVRLIALILGCATTLPATAQELLGSGSTFVFPVMSEWTKAYEKACGTRVRYQPIGSSAGLTEILSSVVDFGVSDAPLVDPQLLRDGLAQFPLVIGAIVPIVNLDGVAPGELRFTGKLLADIYLGRVKNWSDPAIAAVNPGLKLPHTAILVIHRSDGSGTTFNWANFLSKASDEWNARVGASTKVAWPVGSGGQGNGGVADNVSRVKGAIGYVEYSYALRRKLAYGLIRNLSGNFVQPGATSFLAAVADVDWTKPRDFFVLLTDPPGENAYPVMATSFVLIRKYPVDLARSRDTLAFFRWVMENGQAIASALDYLPLPSPLVHEVESYWRTEMPERVSGG